MSRRGSGREYERSARVGQLLREILAGELDAIDDDRVFAVALTGVDVDNELETAVVHFDADHTADALEAPDEHAGRRRRPLSSHARLRTTPRLSVHLAQAVGIGGPDGVADACSQRAGFTWSRSSMTLPHGRARVMVTEALYRAWSMNSGHPYHRA